MCVTVYRVFYLYNTFKSFHVLLKFILSSFGAYSIYLERNKANWTELSIKLETLIAVCGSRNYVQLVNYTALHKPPLVVCTAFVERFRCSAFGSQFDDGFGFVICINIAVETVLHMPPHNSQLLGNSIESRSVCGDMCGMWVCVCNVVCVCGMCVHNSAKILIEYATQVALPWGQSKNGLKYLFKWSLAAKGIACLYVRLSICLSAWLACCWPINKQLCRKGLVVIAATLLLFLLLCLFLLVMFF